MFDINAIFTDKLNTQKGTVTGFLQEGTIEITPAKGNKAIPCFILKNSSRLNSFALNDEVLFISNSGDEYGYIMGVIDRYMPVTETSDTTPKSTLSQTEHLPAIAEIDGRKVNIEAKNEIILKCGKSSITLQKNGQITLKGTNLVSRASSVNKLKGGSVSIN